MASRAHRLAVAGRADGISWSSQRRSFGPPEASSGRYGPSKLGGRPHQGLSIPVGPTEGAQRARAVARRRQAARSLEPFPNPGPPVAPAPGRWRRRRINPWRAGLPLEGPEPAWFWRVSEYRTADLRGSAREEHPRRKSR